MKPLYLEISVKNWLSSVFYFGWVGWALPTNLLMQKFPLGKYLAVNVSRSLSSFSVRTLTMTFTRFFCMRIPFCACYQDSNPCTDDLFILQGGVSCSWLKLRLAVLWTLRFSAFCPVHCKTASVHFCVSSLSYRIRTLVKPQLIRPLY